MTRPLPFILLVALACACDSTADAALDKGKAAAGDLADKAGDKAKTLADGAVDKSKEKAGELADKASDKAKSMWDDVPDSGELSDSATDWLKKQSEGDGIERAIVKGKQVAPVALEIGKTVKGAVDEDTAIEPIFQKVDDGGRTPAEVDKAISDMPRTEVIDGLTVGFKQIDELSEKVSVKERGYLVMWRHEGHLVGFVYRSRREIDVETLVKEAPRLIKLVQAVSAED